MAESEADRFSRELRQAICEFLGAGVKETVNVHVDLINCLEVQAFIMVQYNAKSRSRVYQEALDAMMTVSEKLATARTFRSIVGRIAGATGSERTAERLKLLNKLSSYIEIAKTKAKRV